MSTRLGSTLARAAVILPMLAGCVSINAAPAARERLAYAPQEFLRIRDSVAAARSEEEAGGRDARVKIIAPSMIGVDHYVDASVRVTQDAYVIVVASDLDGRFRVVFPESPEQSGFVSAAVPRRMSKFFAGFGTFGSARFGRSAFSVQPVSRFTPRGVMVAIASDRPLQFERLTDRNGDWDEVKLEQLAHARGATAIGYALGSQLTLAGQTVDADYSGFTRFASLPQYSLANLGSNLCESDATNALYFDPPPATRYFERNGVMYAVIYSGDACSGYEQRIVPVNPDAVPRLRGEDSAQTSGAVARFPSRPADGIGGYASSQLDETIARARRSRPVDAEGSALRPADRPNVVGGMRFRPPEQLRTDPRLRDANGGVGTPTADGRSGGWMENRERERRRMEAEQQRATRPLPRSDERPRPEPVRQQPPAVREAPAPAPAPPAEAPSGKPRKE